MLIGGKMQREVLFIRLPHWDQLFSAINAVNWGVISA